MNIDKIWKKDHVFVNEESVSLVRNVVTESVKMSNSVNGLEFRM